MTKIDREHCWSAARDLNETNDCVVRACAVALQIDYTAMHAYLEGYGRPHRGGMAPVHYHRALRDLGATLTRLHGPQWEYDRVWVEGTWVAYRGWRRGHYRTVRKQAAPGEDYNAATVVTLQRELDTGVYLVQTSGHVLCLRDGTVYDYTDGGRYKVKRVYRVEY